MLGLPGLHLCEPHLRQSVVFQNASLQYKCLILCLTSGLSWYRFLQIHFHLLELGPDQWHVQANTYVADEEFCMAR